MLALSDLRRTLATHEPRVLPGWRRAAVAVVVHEAATGSEMLFIERAKHPHDPWSGHMAFPGGRVDPGDRDERDAAERETLEEVGLSLVAAERLGRLDDLQAGVRLLRPLVLSAFVYQLAVRTDLTLNHEVAEALWVPVRTLLDPACHIGYRVGPTRWPGVSVGAPDRQVVWGLTYRLLEGFFGVLGIPFPTQAR